MTPRSLCAMVALALLAAGCGGSTDESSSPGVSFLDYSPKPYSKDMSLMTVSFTTTGPAGPGREYQVWLFTGNDNRDRHCYSEWAPYDGVPGEAGKTYTQTLETWGSFSDGEAGACFGRAELVVWTQRADAGVAVGRKDMRKLSLRILPVRTEQRHELRRSADGHNPDRLPGLPAIGRNVSGATRHTDPVRALLATEKRRRRLDDNPQRFDDFPHRRRYGAFTGLTP